GDVGMAESGQDRSFPPKAFFSGTAHEARVEELDCGDAFEAPVAPPGEPDAAHPALSDRRYERVGAQRLAGQRRGDRHRKRLLQKLLGFEGVPGVEKFLEVPRQCGFLALDLREPCGALTVVQLEGPIEE